VRPTPSEVIEGVRRILRDVVAPEVSSEYARSRLRAVLAVLAEVDWDDAPLRLLRDNQDLQTLLDRCEAWAAEDPARAAAFDDLRRPASAPAGERLDGPSFADLNRLNGEYRSLVARMIGSLDTWRRRNPGDASTEALWRDVLEHFSTR
jgi:hypothetical protein